MTELWGPMSPIIVPPIIVPPIIVPPIIVPPIIVPPIIVPPIIVSPIIVPPITSTCCQTRAPEGASATKGEIKQLHGERSVLDSQMQG